jgi:hypothetical protein
MHPAGIGVERLNGFTGEVLLRMESKQPFKFRQGILGPDVIVPADQTRAVYPCYVPDRSETIDAYRMTLVAIAEVKDARGRTRHMLSKMPADDNSVAITVEGAILKLTCSQPDMPAVAGSTREIPFRISRSAKLKGPVRIELRGPREFEQLVTARPLIVPEGQTEARLPVTFAAELPATDLPACVIRGVALQEGNVPRLAEGSQYSPLDPEAMTILKTGKLPVLAETTIHFTSPRPAK